MDIYSEVKKATYARGFSLKELAKRFNNPMSLQNLSNKLRKGSLRAHEYKEIGSILGIDLTLEFVPKHQAIERIKE